MDTVYHDAVMLDSYSCVWSEFEEVRDRLRELESSVSVAREDDTAADCPICQSYLRYLGKPYQGHCHAGGTQNLSKVHF